MPQSHKSVVMLLTLTCLTALAAGQDWPMLGHDTQRTNAAPLAVEPPYRITWAWYGQNTAGPNGPFPKIFRDVLSHWTQPVVATVATEPLTPETGDEEPPKALRVFVGTLAGNVYAIDAASGANAWRASVGGPVINTLAVQGRYVFAACGDGKVYAFDVATGMELWQQDIGTPLTCSPLPADSQLFIAGRDAKAYALDAATGDILWSAPLDAPAAGSCAYADGRVYLATHAATAYALTARDGEILWRNRMRGQDPWYYPVIAGQAIMFRTKSAVHGPENDGVEKVLAALPDSTDAWPPKDWPLEKTALQLHLEDPDEQNFFVYDRESGEAIFTPAITRVAGQNDCPPWPVVTPTGLVLAHRRVRSSRMTGTYHFGSRYPLEFDQLDLALPGRKPLLALPPNRQLPNDKRMRFFSMDDPHYATVGGHMIYFHHNALGSFAMDLRTGEACGLVRHGRTSTPMPAGLQELHQRPSDVAEWDLHTAMPQTPRRLSNISSGVVPAGGALFVNMGVAGCLVRLDGKGSGSPPLAATEIGPVPVPSPGLDDPPPLTPRVPVNIAVSEVLTPGAIPPAAKELQMQLIEQVREVLRTGHLAPLYFLSGEADGVWLFDSPADVVWALAEAMPLLPRELRRETARFLREEMDAYPLWQPESLPTDDGVRREYFPIEPKNRRVRDIARLREIALRRFYALWLYAYHADNSDYVRANWPAIKAFATDTLQGLTPQDAAWGDLTGLIGLARLAIMAEDPATYEAALLQISRLANVLSDVDAVRKRFPEQQRLCAMPSMIRMADDEARAGAGILLADLAPATVRVLDAEKLAEHARDIRLHLPAWFLTVGGPTYADGVFDNGCSMPPPIPAGYFMLHAWLGQATPQQLATWTDAPVCRVGDCYYIRKLAAAITRTTATTYEPLALPIPQEVRETP